ncbi:hypothetical protein I5G87_gp80 [Mycobacterium phage Ekdilam]|uniref:Uncharacterized protein n=1 Tax=Mycobacterium phage Ekdilam TaxID=2599862 RepID=A0A5J6TN78_9CAUD|nr:hypothetical protein I5G87_gp80 [Mycobacterium phage Ekdilam]QFG11504.1 hypothetical protein PBI_EKDILAM_80 [Mycobacterium phage Ekdilam]
MSTQGFSHLGKLAKLELTAMADDTAIKAWGNPSRTVRTVGDMSRTFPFTLGQKPARPTTAERLRRRNALDPYAAMWHLIFGVDVRPARPTVREALVDVWDALRALWFVLVEVVVELAVAAYPKVRTFRTRLADVLLWSWLDPLGDRWDALRAPYTWGRLPGPLLRFWTAEFGLLHTEAMPRERVAVWLRRVVVHVWRAVRHG